jgi:glycosyltransferase involved in cell wall biosynthesis|tara:strand:+ start:1126 stop:1803 length:678 start_codon:yes stop_codon:yes gene_type:complete
MKKVKYKLSILILTHNRPELFKRCFKAILNCKPDYPIEIIVNNDSSDIDELYSDDDNITVRYYYKKYKKLGDVYKFLYTKSQGDFIYYNEDDDYIKPCFFDHIDYKHDLYIMNYISYPLIQIHGIIKAMALIDNSNLTKLVFKDYLKYHDNTQFQLGQIVFKRQLVEPFFRSNYASCLEFDYNLFKSLNVTTFKYIKTPTWCQTTDGKDNLSFKYLNNDKRYPTI